MSKTTFTRRNLLKTSASLGVMAGTGLLVAPALAQNRSIKIGSYGGYFEDSLKSHVYPAFTEATGIAVESVTQPDSTSWLQTMSQAISAGNVPADLSMHTPVNIIKGQRLGGILAPIDPRRIPTLDNVEVNFLHRADGRLLGVGALSFYYSMVVNTDEVDMRPKSWADFWDTGRFEASLGLPKNVNFKFLDIVAATFLGGTDALRSHEGIVAAVEKAAEIHPNVALWYTGESQMEQALKNFDVIGGMYFHDVAGLMAADGHPIASIFPKEGNVIDFNSWTLSEGSQKQDEAYEFMAFSCLPETQAIMSRKIGTAPVVDAAKTDLTPEELAAVAGTPAIHSPYEVYLDDETFITETWDRMVAKA
ncbi:extracellular solute-binding protein [Pelagibius litoralis]|uniref:Extracellular solute-binding protein n=1 Tax=Pelagibius litoralis TaxID=374515 RepID=A0A967EZP8_9PROT|nr:extracellular solute-binding protein [Pelagibius litoralis]NIA70370.1 extracellular solute-binding protein [Pelagibius litoralis]